MLLKVVFEKFQRIYSQARSKAASSVRELETSPTLEESIRSRCWDKAVGEKTKGQLYMARDLSHDYEGGDCSLTQKKESIK